MLEKRKLQKKINEAKSNIAKLENTIDEYEVKQRTLQYELSNLQDRIRNATSKEAQKRDVRKAMELESEIKSHGRTITDLSNKLDLLRQNKINLEYELTKLTNGIGYEEIEKIEKSVIDGVTGQKADIEISGKAIGKVREATDSIDDEADDEIDAYLAKLSEPKMPVSTDPEDFDIYEESTKKNKDKDKLEFI